MSFTEIRVRLTPAVVEHLRHTAREYNVKQKTIVETALREYFWPKNTQLRPEAVLSAIKATEYQSAAVTDHVSKLTLVLTSFIRKWLLAAGPKLAQIKQTDHDRRTFDLFLTELGLSYDEILSFTRPESEREVGNG